MKIVLHIPNYGDYTFESYEDLNIIWEIMESYKDCTISLVYDDAPQSLEQDEGTIVKESVESINNEEGTAHLQYIVPKSVTFTQRFQDRINKEVSDILNSVYPDMFNISGIRFEDIEPDSENMKMYIDVKANNESALNTINYLDKNVEYIIKDLVDYYI